MSLRHVDATRRLAQLGGAAIGFFLLKGLAWLALLALGAWAARG